MSDSISDKRQRLREKTWKKSTTTQLREREQLRKTLLLDEIGILIVNELNSIRNKLPLFGPCLFITSIEDVKDEKEVISAASS